MEFKGWYSGTGCQEWKGRVVVTRKWYWVVEGKGGGGEVEVGVRGGTGGHLDVAEEEGCGGCQDEEGGVVWGM